MSLYGKNHYNIVKSSIKINKLIKETKQQQYKNKILLSFKI